jgi:hypothetical protein
VLGHSPAIWYDYHMSGIKLEAYSHLGEVLSNLKLTIPELQRQLRGLGVAVNIKSLYRLISPEPLQKIDTRIVGAICQTCQVGIGDVIEFSKPQVKLQQLDAPEQKRLDQLMSKNNEGAMSQAERQELDELAGKAHKITMANARVLVAQRRAGKAGKSARNPKPARRGASR